MGRRLIPVAGQRAGSNYCGVREAVGRRVGVLDVDEGAVVVDDDVRVLVVSEERRDQVQALAERAVQEQLAVGRDLVADQQVQVLEPEREQQPGQRRVELDAGRRRSSAFGAGSPPATSPSPRG